ncbi:MAG: hypothetical protein HOC93_09125 [Phycisphaerae bacterium]|jgi:hypothetical protein|nr:hypothetical protein [Phycisphaerae bacterium]
MGWVEDCNANGIPDDCECAGDANQDGNANIADILVIVGYWGNNTPIADLNCDGIVNVVDLLIVIDNWGPCE